MADAITSKKEYRHPQRIKDGGRNRVSLGVVSQIPSPFLHENPHPLCRNDLQYTTIVHRLIGRNGGTGFADDWCAIGGDGDSGGAAEAYEEGVDAGLRARATEG